MIQPKQADVAYRKQEMIDSMPPEYNESPEMNAIMYANAVEIERKKAEAEDLLNQLFVRTATWGLDNWDRVLALDPQPRMPINQRRERILAKLNGTATATIQFLIDVINVYTQDKDTYIDEFPAEYRFEAVISNKNQETISLANIYAAINEVKPAHLQFGLVAGSMNKLNMKHKAYTWEVKYPVTNRFNTAPIDGMGRLNESLVLQKKQIYTFPVNYPVCGNFTAGGD